MTSRTLRRRCRYRVVETMPGRFAVIERFSGDVVEAGFAGWESAWAWVANRLDGRA
jgi:hypothetical protein